MTPSSNVAASGGGRLIRRTPTGLLPISVAAASASPTALPLFVLVPVAWRYPSVRVWIAACASTMVFGLVVTRAYIYPMNDVLFVKAGGDLGAFSLPLAAPG